MADFPAPTPADLAAFEDLISRLPAEQQGALGRAREAYNAERGSDDPGPWDTDAEYWFFVFTRASQSYLNQYPPE